jgi:Zn-dependent M16 (insulinase) family peptidase
LDNFAGTVNYLSAFNADSIEMSRYIIGTIANLDFPLTPSEKGNLAFRWHIEKTSQEEIQADRDAVLTTTAADIRNMSDVVAKILEPQVFCVYGNEDILKSNKSLFKDLVVLQK